jgi:hypothetical protein
LDDDPPRRIHKRSRECGAKNVGIELRAHGAAADSSVVAFALALLAEPEKRTKLGSTSAPGLGACAEAWKAIVERRPQHLARKFRPPELAAGRSLERIDAALPRPRPIDPAATPCVGCPEPLKESPAMVRERPPRSAASPGLLAACLSIGLLTALPALAQGGGGGGGGAGGGGAAGGSAGGAAGGATSGTGAAGGTPGGATSGTGTAGTAAGTGRGGGTTSGTAAPGATGPSAAVPPGGGSSPGGGTAGTGPGSAGQGSATAQPGQAPQGQGQQGQAQQGQPSPGQAQAGGRTPRERIETQQQERAAAPSSERDREQLRELNEISRQLAPGAPVPAPGVGNSGGSR